MTTAQTLDPALNSIAFLTLLDLVQSAPDATDLLLDQTLDFLLHFDACQVRYVGASFLELLDRVGTGVLFPVRQRPLPLLSPLSIRRCALWY